MSDMRRREFLSLRARRERPGGRRAADERDEVAASHVGHRPSSCRGVTTSNRQTSIIRLSLPQSGLQVLGADLNCSESRRRPAPSIAFNQTRIAPGKRLYGHVDGIAAANEEARHYSTLLAA
jgi:hypothetical protein